MENYSYEVRDPEEVLNRNMLRVRKIELAKTKKKVKKAKDDVAQSGLNVRPLINELEKLKSNLNAMNSRITIANAVILQLETELETPRNFIRFKKDMELKLRLNINKLNQAMDRTREEMEQLVLEKNKQRRLRTELQQALRLKKQSLKTLQLTLRAIRLESEAIGASMTQAVRHIHCSETDIATVALLHEEYYELMKRAKEETLLVDWRVSVSLEQRLVAEASRDSASRRLKEISKKKLMERENNEQKGEDLFAIEDEEEEKSRVKSEIEVIDEGATQAKLIPWSSKESSPPLNRRLKRIKRSVQIKKPSALVRIRSCLRQKLIILLQ